MVSRILDGKVAVVAGGSVAIGRSIVAGLIEAGAMVVSIGPLASASVDPAPALELEVDLFDRAAVHAALSEIADTIGPLDVSVYSYINPKSLVMRPMVGLTEDEWDQLVEAPIRSLVWWLQATEQQLQGQAGRIIAVCPTAAIEGAAGLVALSAAAEGQRSLIKSAAQRWGGRGVTCNIVAPPVWVLSTDLAGTDSARNVPVLQPADDPLKEVGSAVVMLSTPWASRLTGITVNADSGALMLP